MHVANLTVASIVPREKRALTSGVDDVRVSRIGRDVAGLTAADVVHPVAQFSGPRAAQIRPIVRGKTERGIILLRTAHVIWKIRCHRDVIQLRGREIFFGPCPSGVHRNRPTAIVRLDHALIIVRRDP